MGIFLCPPRLQSEKSAGRYTMKEAHQHLKFFILAFSKTQTLLKTPQELNLFAVLSVSSEVGSLHFCPNKHRLRAARTKSENWPKTRCVCRLVSSASRHREKRFLPPTPCPGSWQAASGKSHGAHPLHGLLEHGGKLHLLLPPTPFLFSNGTSKTNTGKNNNHIPSKKVLKEFPCELYAQKIICVGSYFYQNHPTSYVNKGPLPVT